MMKKLRKVLILLMMLLMICGVSGKAAKIKLNKTSVKLTVGQSQQIKLNGAKGNIKWKSSDNAVVTVSKGIVKAKKAGKANITATYKGKKYVCKVTVLAKEIEINPVDELNKLKNYVITNGKYNSEINSKYVINYFANNDMNMASGIIYYFEKNYIDLYFRGEDSSGMEFYCDIILKDDLASSVFCEYYEDGNTKSDYSRTDLAQYVNPKSIALGTKIPFITNYVITESDDLERIISEIEDIANERFQIGLTVWSKMLCDVGSSFKKLGFVNIK